MPIRSVGGRMFVLREGVPPSNGKFRWLPAVEFDDTTGRLLWATIGWAHWFRHWLPAHVVQYLDERALERCIREHGRYGDWWKIPDGYQVEVIRKSKGAACDPLTQYDTIGLKFTWK